jgi:hypothetical protein
MSMHTYDINTPMSMTSKSAHRQVKSSQVKSSQVKSLKNRTRSARIHFDFSIPHTTEKKKKKKKKNTVFIFFIICIIYSRVFPACCYLLSINIPPPASDSVPCSIFGALNFCCGQSLTDRHSNLCCIIFIFLRVC